MGDTVHAIDGPLLAHGTNPQERTPIQEVPSVSPPQGNFKEMVQWLGYVELVRRSGTAFLQV